MSNPNALFLLADHIKLSLLERQRAKSLNLETDAQDGHVSRSLDQFKDGLEALRQEQKRLEMANEATKASTLADSLPDLEKQLDDLTAQFHGFSTPSAAADTAMSAHDPTLADPVGSAASSGAGQASKKTVRFSEAHDLEAQNGSLDAGLDAARSRLFPYRDDPDADAPAGYRDAAGAMDNVQVHEYHRQVLDEQDAQLDALGASISRQRELSMQIGDELDSQVLMLDESERVVDRHQSRLDRAQRQMGRFSRAAGESKQMAAIIVLIVILVLLIIMLK